MATKYTFNQLLRPFLVYAYTFIFIYMVNSLITWGFIKAGFPPALGTAVEFLITTVGLFFSYKFVMSKYFGITDEKQVVKGWLYQFIPFVFISFLLFYGLFLLLKVPSLTVFIYLNLEIVALYFTFKFSLKRIT